MKKQFFAKENETFYVLNSAISAVTEALSAKVKKTFWLFNAPTPN